MKIVFICGIYIDFFVVSLRDMNIFGVKIIVSGKNGILERFLVLKSLFYKEWMILVFVILKVVI